MSLFNKLQTVVRDMLHRVQDRHATTSHVAAPAPATTPIPPTATVVVKKPNWEMRTQAELVDHIVHHFHARLHRDLPRVIEAARHIEREHAGHPALPTQLADDLATFAMELEGHMRKEETVLFPMLRSGARGGQLDMPIRMMERDHDDHSANLVRMRRQTGDFTPPADAGAAWLELYSALATIERDLREHMYLEDNVLFARARGHRDD